MQLFSWKIKIVLFIFVVFNLKHIVDNKTH